ncbi:MULTISPECIES: helix-turn-helix domain-containing protein [Streptomyces]|uniref:Transcriptional regulator n=1 Tax=Streptomyces tsukubensis (strain DSM 42081 / NBRC 108919 / NRRL 18488 / 9993) TaxID=1114943 RepID=I2N2I5_STRT9|nr:MULTISPECIES: helix-turn-helix transcriptional regulator [Streptomyces]AZK95350.1 transcriptional regulator [Streptomyces tsukubensis]EIF91232.1 XRE family transcriptional regulator [Streptomyces tsukubensis NRRL18488]MYS66326.1 transcriptional regulator [Streptomyces sp. SID5473]QKM68601.1 transcriptional regulator [Streptomyces tsukubensis NRRL18488]TAI43409.1 transcriptional regulator [Streptomyces tsukubensis]
MATPNSALRAVRMGLLMSQDDFARAVREAGIRAGQPNDANKRLVQRWESGTTTAPRAVYARALEAVTGLPIDALGFDGIVIARVTDTGPAGDSEPSSPGTSPTARATPAAMPHNAPATAHRNYSGVWLSRYEYYSSSRDATHTGLHYVVILQHGDRLTVRSLPGSSDSPLTIDLHVDGHVVTGTWTEQTAADGYYRGARYHGAVQLLVEPTGRRMAGKWVGFGKDFDINTGPWTLTFEDASTTKATLASYDRKPAADS